MLEQRWAVREPVNIFAVVRHHSAEARIPKAKAHALCAAGMLSTAVEALLTPGVMCGVARGQGRKVLKWYRVAVREFLPGAVPPSMERKIKRQNEEVVRIGKRVLGDVMYCSPFTVARIMAAHLFLEHMIKREKWGRSWRYFEQTTATLLSMLLQDLGEDEERMYALAEEMFPVFAG